jgi:pimeloyl-ACP methyl ester carboxylesterase
MHPRLKEWKLKGQYTTFNNLKIFYRITGVGPALMIVHGYPYNGFDFEKIIDSLSTRFTVIIPDLPGMGFSDKPKNHPYSFNEFADLYTFLLQKLEVNEVHFLSHDLGNSIVQELLARDVAGAIPFKIKSVAFLNGGLFTDVYRPRKIQILLSKSPDFFGKVLSRILTKAVVMKSTSEVFGSNKPSAALQDIFWDILNYNDGKAIAYLLGRLVFEKDVHQRKWINAMQQTSIPQCFINGPADPNSGIQMAKRYQELIPRGKVFILQESVGHWPQIEAPDETLHTFYLFHDVARDNK